MRFLDRRWAEEKLDEFRQDMHFAVYLRHVQAIADDLPPRLRAFARVSHGLGLRGAKLIKARLNREKRSLRVVLLLPGEPQLNAKLRLLYSSLRLDSVKVRTWKKLAKDPETTCLADEVDLAPDGMYEHRILFKDGSESAVRFRRFKWEVETLPPGYEHPHGGWRIDG